MTDFVSDMTATIYLLVCYQKTSYPVNTFVFLLITMEFTIVQLILSFWIDFGTKLVQIMAKEFAKTPILG